MNSDNLQACGVLRSTRAEEVVRRFIVEALTPRMPRLIPFTLQSHAAMRVAEYLFKYG